MARSKSYSNEVVLERAMNAFWRQGYEATSMRRLEKEMGINQFSIYATFQSKKNLFIQAIQNYRDYVKKHHFYALLQDDAGLAELERFLLKAVSTDNPDKDEKGCLVVNTAGEVGNKDSDIAHEINQYYEFIQGMLKNVIRNAIKKGEIPSGTDIEKQANFFLGVMQSISVASKTMDKNQIKDFIAVSLEQIR